MFLEKKGRFIVTNSNLVIADSSYPRCSLGPFKTYVSTTLPSFRSSWRYCWWIKSGKSLEMSNSSSWENLLLVGGWYRIFKIPETLVVACNCSFIFRRFKKIHGTTSWVDHILSINCIHQNKQRNVPFLIQTMTPDNIYFCLAKIKTSKMFIWRDCQPLRFFRRVRYFEQSLDIMGWTDSTTWDESLTFTEPMIHHQDDVNRWYKKIENSNRQPCIWKLLGGGFEHPKFWFAKFGIMFFGFSVLVPWDC